jgi:LCP family protein required for cell wall assembly
VESGLGVGEAVEKPTGDADETPASGSDDIPADPPKPIKAPGRDPLWARLLIFFGILLILGASGAIAATKVLAARYDSTVRKGTLIAPNARSGGGDEARSSLTGPLNYLLIGSDARAEDPTAGARSDTIIIVHIPVTMDRAYLISIPRDLRVQIPPFPATGFPGAHEKINGAFEYGHGGDGGVQLLSATLSQLMGITFDGAAVVDFSGFQKAIGLLGGVYMCIDERTESHHIGHDKNGNFLAPWYGPDGDYRNYESTPVVYEPGCRHLDPWEALDYSRQRKSIPDGDYGRQRHQQQLLKAMFDEARRQGVATNPGKLDSLIRSVGQSLTVDTNGVPLADLVYALRDIKPADLIGIKVPSEPQDLGGISYVLALEDQASALYDAVRSDNLDNWVLANPDWVNGL